MNTHRFSSIKHEVIISSITALVVIGLLYKGVSAFWDEEFSKIFHQSNSSGKVILVRS